LQEPEMLLKIQAVRRDLRGFFSSRPISKPFELHGVVRLSLRPGERAGKEMLKMKIDPTMCMKTQARLTKLPKTDRAL
jgi:hypothetical protein